MARWGKVYISQLAQPVHSTFSVWTDLKRMAYRRSAMGGSRVTRYADGVMAATVIPASVFAAHANKLRTIRLEKLAQSIRRPPAPALATTRRPVATSPEVTRKIPRRPGLFGR